MLIKNGSKILIVIPKDATPREVFAAEELKKYINKIVGSDITICDDKAEIAGMKMIIGAPMRNEAARKLISEEEFKSYVTGREGFMIKSFPDALLLAGSEGDCERGSIYAVYEFLERFACCSLSAYSHPDVNAGEWVPEKDELNIEEISYVKPESDRYYRGACIQYGSSAGNSEKGLNIPFFDWLAKNRYNYIYTWMSVYEGLKKQGLVEEAQRRGLEFMVGHHDVTDFFLPPEGNETFPEKYYTTHPEYFRLQEDGKRYKPDNPFGQIVLCSRNEELIEEISKNIISWLRVNPTVKRVQLAPHDGVEPHCVCPLCSPYSKMENYTYFMNEVAKRVSKACPDVKLVMMLYSDIWEYPGNIELSPAMMIIEATWFHPEGLYRGIRTGGQTDGSGLNDSFFEKNLLKWKEAGAEVMYYEYYMNVYAARQRHTPIADEIQAIWKNFAEKGIVGAMTQIECYNLWNYIFNFYTFGRTAYDSSLSLDDNLERFGRIFGNGAPYVIEAIKLSEESVNGDVCIPFAPYQFIDNIDIEKMYDLYEKALDAAENERARNNVRLMRMEIRYTDLSLKIDPERKMPGHKVYEYPDILPEILYMTNYDSYWKNDPGYAIAFPATGETKEEFTPDKWYMFE